MQRPQLELWSAEPHPTPPIYQQLTPADRFRQGCSISDTARQVVAFRIRKENPKMSIQEANRLALERAYQS